jgi:citrate lyase subunit beta/citryl-CoA lyase
MSQLRTVLFAPGDQPRKMARALTSGADATVLDLEDAVAAEAKSAARRHVRDLLLSHPGRAHVRINPLGTEDYERDLTALGEAIRLAAGLIVPKVEALDQLLAINAYLTEIESYQPPAATTPLLAVLESSAGIMAAGEIARAPRLRALILGTLDLAADLGVAPSASGLEFLHARSQLVLASRAAGIDGPIDGPHSLLDDPAGLEASSNQTRQLGFRGRAVIHPDQVAIVNRAFSPSEDELVHARKVVDAHRTAQAEGLGAVRLADGTFIDRPVVVRAAALLGLTPQETDG